MNPDKPDPTTVAARTATRERALEYVKGNPGCTTRAVAEALTGEGAARSKGRRRVASALLILEGRGTIKRARPADLAAYRCGVGDTWTAV